MSIEKIQLLQNSSLLENVDSKYLSDLANKIVIKKLPKENLIFLQGDTAENLYFIVNGWIKVYRQDIDGNESVIDLISTGETLGSDVIFDGKQYNSCAQTIDNVELGIIPIEYFKDFIARNHEISFQILRSMSKKLKETELQLEHLLLMSAPQRIGCFLIEKCRNHNVNSITLSLPIDKSIIASKLNMTAETFSRSLKKLKEVGVSSKGVNIIINDIELLKDYTCVNCSNPESCSDDQIKSCNNKYCDSKSKN